MADNQSIVAGMFSTPEQYQQQQLQQLYANQLAQAQLSPIQQASFDIGAGAQRLGNAVGGLMGVEDPQMKVLSIRNQVGKEINWNDPQSLANASRQLLQAGDIQGSQQLAAQAQALQDKLLANMKTQSEVSKNMREQKTTDQRNYDAAVEGGYKGSFQQWMDRQKLLGRNVTNVSVDVGKAISQVTGKAIGEQISKMGESLSGLSKFERSVDTVEKLLPNSFTGMGADTAKQLNKAASMLGASKGEKASNTEILENTFNNIVLPMARQLPGSIAAKELTFLLTTKPALQQEPTTIRRLMKQMLEDYKADAQTYEESQRYYKKNKSYEGFDVNQARYNVGKRMNIMSSLEDKVRAGTATKDEAQKLLDMRQGKDQTND